MLILLKIFYKVYFLTERYFFFLLLLIRYRRVQLVLKGKGGAHKFLIIKSSEYFFVKKYSRIGDWWDKINARFNSENRFNPPSIIDKLNVSNYIKGLNKLNNYAFITQVDFERKEVWSRYHLDAVDYDFSIKAINRRVEKVLKLFHLNGLWSEDHLSSNIMLLGTEIIIIDIDSFAHN